MLLTPRCFLQKHFQIQPKILYLYIHIHIYTYTHAGTHARTHTHMCIIPWEKLDREPEVRVVNSTRSNLAAKYLPITQITSSIIITDASFLKKCNYKEYKKWNYKDRKIYFASVNVGENGAPAAVAEAQLDNGRSEENELRPSGSHHFFSHERRWWQDHRHSSHSATVAFAINSLLRWEKF